MGHNHQDPDAPPVERGSSGFGTLIAFGTAALATVSAVAMLGALNIAAPLIAVTVGGLGLLGGGLLLLQNHKENVNQKKVTARYGMTEGYHKEPEPVEDLSLIHQIKGRSDLPARTKYIRDNYGEYGIKPMSADQFRGKRLGPGLALGVAVAAVTMIGITAVAGTGMFVLGFAGVMATLFGGTALLLHTRHTMNKYDAYIDGQAAEGQQRQQEADASCARDVEYDNGRDRTRTFCADIDASRREQAAAEACR